MNTTVNAEETSIRRLAAVLSLLIHGLLFAAMVMMVDWKSVHVAPAMMEVTLWDSLPAKSAPNVPEVPTPPPETPELVALTEPPEPVAAEAEDSAAEITIKKQEAERQKEEKLKEDKRKAQLKKVQEKLQDELRKEEDADKLKKIQAALRQQELAVQASSAAADPSVLAFFVQKMRIKVRGNLIQSLCPPNNPELIIEMRLTPTGDIASSPKLVKTSGDNVCDAAVIRAVLAAGPFELPADVPAKNKFLDTIRLKFKPHD